MIDHVSIAVRDLTRSQSFYDRLLPEINFENLVVKEGTVGYGKKYAEFWINERSGLTNEQVNDGFHVCLRVRNKSLVEAFYQKALELGAESNGEPGFREIYSSSYYAAFVHDPDGNKIEVVTFVEE